MVVRSGCWNVRVLAYLLASITALSFTGVVTAEAPWKKLIPFKSVEADRNRPYWLTEDQGPWLIFVTSFAGQGAERDAQQLVWELRARFKLEAYMHKKRFDFSEPIYGRGLNKYGGPKRMKYKNTRSFDEIAVLVGNYASHESPAAEDDLEKIKTARPECLGRSKQSESGTTQRFNVLRELQRLANQDPDQRKKGPLRRAFVARNPLLPKEFFVGMGLDPFVEKMNKGVEHSLLDCPGKYTVRVASFRGKSEFVGQEAEEEEERGGLKLPGLSKPTDLEQAAINAHKLTELLRDKGVEAYEFHDRYESVVTIGSFASVGNKMADGRLNLHPQVYQIMQAYGGQQCNLPGQARGMQPRTEGGIPFDLQPVPVMVPRRSIGNDYAAGNHTMR